MLVHRFPDLTWLKQQIHTGFAVRGGDGWPTVLLHVKGAAPPREAIQGPLSLFVNLQGQSHVRHEGRTLSVQAPSYALTNAGSYYDLHPTADALGVASEVLNCHFGTAFLRQATAYCTARHAEQLLDQPFEGPDALPHFPFHLTARSPAFDQALYQVRTCYATPHPHSLRESALLHLLDVLLQDQYQLQHSAERLQARKASTRTELLRRLRTAVDFLQAHYHQPLDLNSLAQHCCLSKFHLSRSFKAVYGCAPYQYVQQLRLNAVLAYLPQSKDALQTIAQAVGLDNASSLSRLVFRATGQYPSAYRSF